MLNWLAISTRPDISLVVSLFSTYNSKPSKGQLDTAQHVGRYLKSTPSHGIFKRTLCGFADSNWGP